MAHHLALIDFGSVGQGLAQIVRDKGDSLRQNLGVDLKIVAVCTATKGSLYHPDGLDAAKLLDVVAATGHLAAYPDSPGLERGWDSLTTIRQSTARTIVETTPTNLTTGQPTIDYCRAAFESGKNVVTANKGPAARQLVRKVSGYRQPSRANQAAFNQAVAEIATSIGCLLDNLESKEE